MADRLRSPTNNPDVAGSNPDAKKIAQNYHYRVISLLINIK